MSLVWQWQTKVFLAATALQFAHLDIFDFLELNGLIMCLADLHGISFCVCKKVESPFFVFNVECCTAD